MKFKYTIQPYQTEAVESVVNIFAGQPINNRWTYRRDVAEVKTPVRDEDVERNLENWRLTDEELKAKLEQAELERRRELEESYIGFANARVQLTSQQLLENIRRTQSRNNIKLSDTLEGSLGACSLDVEMETGTGKTYVYIKTMFELNKRYGWSKFIVVVPSIAIREGVRKSFDTMQEHFMEHYGKKARFFVYDSKNLSEIDNFSQSADISVMIINTQAFNTSFNEEKNQEGRGGDAAARIIFKPQDNFGSRKPIDVIAANCPIIVMDEPQKMGGVKTQAALKKFNALFCLNYSATHKQHHNLVYVLDALDAYNKRLVKRIEVKGFDIRNLHGTDSYLFLESIVISPNKPPVARIEMEIKFENTISRKPRIVGVDDSLFDLSNDMEQYRGFHVNEIDPIQGIVSFLNGKTLRVGEVVGDVSEADLRRIQIRETIRSHFEKEKDLFSRGIKTLSLFFIDEVAKYRKYDEDGNEINSDYGDIFEREYTDILNEYLTLFNTPYEQYLRSIEVHQTHAGYFSIDKKGRKIDSSLKRGSTESDDISAYDLILKDKERLLSFSNPVRFIFSHSALREGWDNPNVFQICTLKHGGGSPIQKRQEVGRGLRLCVNQSGDRMDADALGSQVQEINQLTVITSHGYRDFVADLQRGIYEDLYERPTKASKEYFAGKTIIINGNDVMVTVKQGNDIYRYLIKNDYIDDEDHITEKYRADLADGVLVPLPESCEEISEGVHALIQGIFDKSKLDGLATNGRNPKVPSNKLNENFLKEEFQTLWAYINHKYAYTVKFDSEELVQKAIDNLNKELFVTELRYTRTKGQQVQDLNFDQLKAKTGFVAESSQTFTMERSESTSIRYDLVGKVAGGTKLTRSSVAKILSGITSGVFKGFKKNPEEFITKSVRLINEAKAELLKENISYHQTAETYDKSIFEDEKHSDFFRAYRAKKNVQDYVFVDGYAKDGQSVERKFAEDMDAANEVCVYAKLPKGFSIPTPVGNYSPDWAIAFREGTVQHIYFVAETKGSADTRKIETAKIICAERLFSQLSSTGVVYGVVKSYDELRDKVNRFC